MEGRGGQNRGVTFMNECSSHGGLNTDTEACSVVTNEIQAYLNLVHQQVEHLNRGPCSPGEEQSYARPSQSGMNRRSQRPGFCNDSGTPSRINVGFENDDCEPWHTRPDGPCPTDPKKSSFPNPCTDRRDTTRKTANFLGSQSNPCQTKSTVNLGTLPWHPNSSSSNNRARVCEDITRGPKKQEQLQEELFKAQSCCKRPPRQTPSTNCPSRFNSDGELCRRPRGASRNLAKLLAAILVVVCIILLIAFTASQLCVMTGYCSGGCKVDKEIYYVPY